MRTDNLACITTGFSHNNKCNNGSDEWIVQWTAWLSLSAIPVLLEHVKLGLGPRIAQATTRVCASHMAFDACSPYLGNPRLTRHVRSRKQQMYPLSPLSGVSSPPYRPLPPNTKSVIHYKELQRKSSPFFPPCFSLSSPHPSGLKIEVRKRSKEGKGFSSCWSNCVG